MDKPNKKQLVEFIERYYGLAAHTDSCIDTGTAMEYTSMILRLDDMKEFYAD